MVPSLKQTLAACSIGLLLGAEAVACAATPPKGPGGPGCPRPPKSQKCKKPFVRREWRTLSTGERDQYIKAVKCLMDKEPETSPDDIPGVRSRYEDFLGTHIIAADDVHFVGAFYPYHRFMVHEYEKEIQTCGWTGGIPYWDWLQDAVDDEAFFNSPIFDVKHGFGGNGDFIPGNFTHPPTGLPPQTPWEVPDRTGGGCIEDGPFAGLKTNLGPQLSLEYNPHCVRRDFAPASFRNLSGPDTVEDGMAQPDYGFFDLVTESTFHSGGHWGVGGLVGTMTDKWCSPADPIFYLHHANVDRAWWSWQAKDLAKRVKDISGPLVNFDYGNNIAGNVTLDHEIYVGETVRQEAKVRDVMHIQRGPLCYEYDTLY